MKNKTYFKCERCRNSCTCFYFLGPWLLQQPFSCLNRKTMTQLQTVWNSATRLLTGSKKYEHITPVIASLDWLPVSFRTDLKILLITFKALHGLAPGYILDLLTPFELECTLRSSGRDLLSILEFRLISRGDRAFAVRPQGWNDLPEEIRLSESVSSFKSRLKTYFYRRAYPEFV